MSVSFDEWRSAHERNNEIEASNWLSNLEYIVKLVIIGAPIVGLMLFLVTPYADSESTFIRVLANWFIPIVVTLFVLFIPTLLPRFVKQTPFEDEAGARTRWALSHGLDPKSVLPKLDYFDATKEKEIVFTQRTGNRLNTYRIVLEDETGVLYDHLGNRVEENLAKVARASEMSGDSESDEMWREASNLSKRNKAAQED